MMLSHTAWEQGDLLLFSWINAPANPSQSMLDLGNFFATWAIFLFPLLVIAHWFFGSARGKRMALDASVSVGIALLINMLIGLLWQHPRPFMVPVGHTFLAHGADSSFPSDHLSVAFAVSFSFIAASRAVQGILLCGVSLAIAWARIYLGVHFPIDIVGSAVVALTGVYLCQRNNQKVNKVYVLFERIYIALFSPAIKKGIFR